MRSFVFVILAAVAMADSEPEAEADAYTLGQIAYGLPQANAYATGHPHNVGVITGVDYGYGRVSGYGAIGNRGYLGYSGLNRGYGGYYGKREADSEADAYTLGQIAYGLPQANAYATGHPHNVGVITGVDYGYGRVSGYGAIGNRGYVGYSGLNRGYGGYYGKREADSEADAYTLGQIAYGLPQANAYATGHPHNVGVITGVDYGYGRVSGYGAIGNRGYLGYSGLNRGYGGYYGKREADSDADSEADAYTLGQIAYGLPQANAYATGHPHNVGVVTGVDYGYGRVSGYGAIGNRGYLGYSGFNRGYGGYYGKREADSDADAYTLGQIAYGLPQANAYATGHPHNVGVITGVDYGYGRVSGYGAVGNRGYSGYSGYGGYGGYPYLG